ncbi:MAG: ComF family protein [Syntrophomonadaceae bacterium]|nr:ComF family protein [Syntrophomonadaceae bacterium]
MSRISRWLDYWWPALLDLLFPPSCLLCRRPIGLDYGRDEQGLTCRDCWNEIGRRPPGLAPCSRCARFLSSPPGENPEPLTCPECSVDPPPFQAAVAAGPYGGTLRQAIHLFKYRGRNQLAVPLAAVMAKSLRPWLNQLGGEVLVVPVPLHRRRLAERGFNQAALLAEALVKTIKRGGTETAVNCTLRYRPGVLERPVETPPQTGLNRAQRRINLAGAFRVAEAEIRLVTGRQILLIDDILTTGSTSAECTRALLAAGSGPVRVGLLAAGLIDPS